MYGISSTVLVYKLHMYKDSHVFASWLTLSIPEIVPTVPSVVDGTRARLTIIYNLFYSLISLFEAIGGIRGSVLSILTQFLSNQSQQVMVDGCRSKLVNVVSGVLQGSVLGPLLFLMCTSELFSILENKLIGSADDSTLMAVVPSPGVRVAVAESLIHDLGNVSEWCDLWGMKLNASKTKSMIVSRSHTMHSQSPPLTIGGTVLKESDDLLFWECI